jgi:phosphoribosylformylglycinamidine cyclo-ligase
VELTILPVEVLQEISRGSFQRVVRRIRNGTWEIPPIFSFLREKGDIPENEMLRTFNNGIGMILIVKTKENEEILGRLNSLGEKAFIIGEIVKAEKEEEPIEFV